MPRARTMAHLGVTAAAAFLATAWAASALPMQAAKPAATSPAVTIEDKVAEGPAPRLARQVKPLYPAEARKENVQGVFTIDVLIGKDGAIHNARVVASAPTLERLQEIAKDESKKGTPAAIEGDARLAQAALDAVKQWQYEPVVKAGKPVEVQATVTVAFKLEEAKAKS